MLDWNKLLYHCLDKVSHHLGHSEARILHSFDEVIPNWERTGRVSTKDVLDFCAKMRMVLQDFNKEEDVLDKPDKKSIISRMPETIREMLVRNSDIMDRDIRPDDLFDNTLGAVKEFEQAFVITAFHEKFKLGSDPKRQVLQAEVVENGLSTSLLPSHSRATASDGPSNSEFQQLLARVATVEPIEEKRISDMKARSARKAANKAARAALQKEEKVGLANSVCQSNAHISSLRGSRTRFLVDTGCNMITVPHESHLDSGTGRPSRLGIRVADDRVSTIHKEGRFGGVRAAVLPQASDALISAEALTRRHIVVLKDSKMIVARTDSQLGVILTTTINDDYSPANVVIEHVNRVYPMREDTARTIIHEKT